MNWRKKVVRGTVSYECGTLVVEWDSLYDNWDVLEITLSRTSPYYHTSFKELEQAQKWVETTIQTTRKSAVCSGPTRNTTPSNTILAAFG